MYFMPAFLGELHPLVGVELDRVELLREASYSATGIFEDS
jgi:hypothetical protein